MDATKKKKTIFAIFPPGSGHMNPILCVISELLKREDAHVIFYSDESFREQIERVGATYRAYSHPTYNRIHTDKPINQGGKVSFGRFLTKHIEIAFDVLPQLLHDLETDSPDMIIYDSFFLMTKYLLEIIKRRKARGEWYGRNKEIVKTIMFIPNFAPCEKYFKQMEKNMKRDWRSSMLVLDSFRRQMVLSWTYGIGVFDPVRLCQKCDNVMNIVSVASELQPCRDQFDDALFKFVGPCLSDQARSIPLDDEIRSVLDQFDAKEDKNCSATNSLKLIYVSMGTVFTVNTFIFEHIFEAFRHFDRSKPNRRFESAQLRVIVSAGRAGMRLLEEKLSSGELTLPPNVFVRAQLPQLDILKRADLFITHCGMNSTSETVKYGVPVVAIPIDADQPMNSRRVCDELELGVRLDAFELSSEKIADAVETVLGDEKYKRNIEKISNSVKNYNGAVDGATLILDYLNRK